MAVDEVRRVLALAGSTSGETLSEELLSKGKGHDMLWLLIVDLFYYVVVAIVTEDYNSSNVFAGDEMTMAYVVREPIVRGIFAARQTQGKAAK